jgi:hypothetical protein
LQDFGFGSAALEDLFFEGFDIGFFSVAVGSFWCQCELGRLGIEGGKIPLSFPDLFASFVVGDAVLIFRVAFELFGIC